MIKLNISKDKFVPKFFPLLFDYSKRWEVYMGSAGSAKSYFITQKIILKSLKEKRRVLVARRYGTTIRNSVFALFKIILNDFKIAPFCKIRESDFNITLPNGSEIIFIGLDDEQKLLSLANISDVFVEEATECTREIVEQLNLRMRGEGAHQQIFMAFNPISSKHWLYNFCVENPPKSFRLVHSTYKDNPFLNKEYVAAIEELRELNPAKYKVYGLGEWGVDVEGLVYQNYEIKEFDVQEKAQKFERRIGMDMGFIDASTIVASFYDRDNKTIYIYKDWYKKGAHLDDIVLALQDFEVRHQLIYCDSADARAIDYFKRNGFRVEGARKGAGSVESGIAFLQMHKLIIHPNCKALINEIENYVYLKDKRTGEYTNQTAHEFSHTLDALRYSYSDIYTNNKLKSLSKNKFGL